MPYFIKNKLLIILLFIVLVGSIVFVTTNLPKSPPSPSPSPKSPPPSQSPKSPPPSPSLPITVSFATANDNIQLLTGIDVSRIYINSYDSTGTMINGNMPYFIYNNPTFIKSDVYIRPDGYVEIIVEYTKQGNKLSYSQQFNYSYFGKSTFKIVNMSLFGNAADAISLS